MIVRVHGKEIETTPEHPFYVDGKGWTDAQELEVGDLLISTDGQLTPLEAIRFTSEKQFVYNLSITNDHTYFVGDADWGFTVWVHNDCVYISFAKNGDVSYVGITNKFKRRAGEHLRKNGREIKRIKGLENVTRKQARAIEHLLIERFGRKFNRAGQSLGGKLDNVIRAINPKKHSQFGEELAWAAKILKQINF